MIGYNFLNRREKNIVNKLSISKANLTEDLKQQTINKMLEINMSLVIIYKNE